MNSTSKVQAEFNIDSEIFKELIYYLSDEGIDVNQYLRAMVIKHMKSVMDDENNSCNNIDLNGDLEQIKQVVNCMSDRLDKYTYHLAKLEIELDELKKMT